jgi:hypothetical protein
MDMFIRIHWLKPEKRLAAFSASHPAGFFKDRPGTRSAMAPHLTRVEQDKLLSWKNANVTVIDMHGRLEKRRERQGIDAPDLTTVRKFLKGKTHRRGRVDKRGQTPIFSRRNVLAMNRARVTLIKKCKNTKQIKWDTIINKARVPEGDRTTAAKAFTREGIDAKLRPIREKPQRKPEHEEERTEICGKMRRYPDNYFSETVDMIIDNKSPYLIWNTVFHRCF